MPQKPYYSRPPLVSVPYAFPSNGTVRAKDERISGLYAKANCLIENPCLWEGLFLLACLTKSRPMDEPVADLIADGIRDAGGGAVEGSPAIQICKIRAALAMYEYTTDSGILKRIAEWLRYLEVGFDHLTAQDLILYRPADLMELLVRYYQITGHKSVLRLCAKLRASAFDWTTALHTFQQSVPLHPENTGTFPELPANPASIDYDDRTILINHAETLADGVRFTLYSGLFSGHGHDLSSGKTVWNQLLKHHGAVCGGTTANPYLCGSGSGQPVANAALAAWAEAFAAQMLLPGSEWALDSLIRIIFNGLDDCLNHREIRDFQYVNTISRKEVPCDDESRLIARLARACAAVYRHAVTLTKTGIRINYLLPERMLMMIGSKPVIMDSDGRTAVFQCENTFTAPVDIYRSPAGTARIILNRDGKNTMLESLQNHTGRGIYLRKTMEWHDRDRIVFEQDGSIVTEETHHQGVCFLSENRLLSLEVSGTTYAVAADGPPEIKDGNPLLPLAEVSGWNRKGEKLPDIPVLPACGGPACSKELKPYSETETRITMFPRSSRGCLK